MAHQYPPNTGQKGIYYTASGGYIDVDGLFSALSSDFNTFAAEALAKSWADGDTVDIRIQGIAGQWELWRAAWDETNERLAVSTIIETKGAAISNGAAVDVSCVVTGKLIEELTAPAAAEWIKVFDREYIAYSGWGHKRPAGVSWRDVKFVFRGLTSSVTTAYPYMRVYLDDVYTSTNVYQWQTMSQIGASGLFYRNRSTGNLVQLVSNYRYGARNLCGELFFFDAESQDYVSFMALIKYEEMTGNMVTTHLFGSITTTGKDITGVIIGFTSGTGTGGVSMYYKQ